MGSSSSSAAATNKQKQANLEEPAGGAPSSSGEWDVAAARCVRCSARGAVGECATPLQERDCGAARASQR